MVPIGITIIVVYICQHLTTKEDADMIYDHIDELMGEESNQDLLVAIDIWNAVACECSDGRKVRSFGFGIEERRNI